MGTPTGIGFFTLSLLSALARRGGARYLGLAHRPPEGAELLRRAGVGLEEQPAPFGVWWQQVTIPRRLRLGDVDLFWSPLSILPLRLPVPAVVTVHDLTAILFPEAHTWKVRWSVYPFVQPTLETAVRIAVDSRATADDLRFHFPECAGRVEVVYPGIDEDFAPAAPAEIETVRAELDCPDGYILYAGTVEPRKNLDLLLDVWETLATEDAATPPLVVAGSYGWQSRRLLARMERLAAAGLRYLGRLPRERLVRVVQGARVFVYPSLYEGFGLPPAEAMACGVPVVASAGSSLPEVVGDAGLLTEPGSGAGLLAAIARLVADPGLAAELGARGRERSARFRWERSAEAMERLLVRAAGVG